MPNTNANLSKLLRERGLRHNYYHRYQPRKLMESMFDENCLYLTGGANWEDLVDKNNINKNVKNTKRYVCCFTYGNTENAALWLLNANIKNEDGLMMRLPKKIMKQIIEEAKNSKVELGRFDKNNKFIKEKDKVKIEDVYITDLYYTNDRTKSGIRKATFGENHPIISEKEYEKTVHVSKAYPWKYENECRLIVEIENKGTKEDVLKLPLNNELVQFIKNNCIVADPVHDFKNEEYNESQLKGKIKFR